MPRIHAPEIEDEPWFPSTLRDALTSFLRVSAERLHIYDRAVPLLQEVLARHAQRGGAARIVDLCAGGGGPLTPLLSRLPDVEVVLTDLYPNLQAFDAAEALHPGRVRGHRQSVDATAVPGELQGVRTLFNALHHFRPEAARSILADAARQRQPIVILEVVERHPAAFASIGGVPLATLALAPFTRPTPAQLLFTYVVPVVPLLTGWDGFASCLRSYSPAELAGLVDGLGDDRYRFEHGQTDRALFPPFRMTWLVGEPA